MSKAFDSTYWQDRWTAGETGWDIGGPSTPLKEYIDQLNDKSLRILIPGCGNAYEGIYLFEKGFDQTWLIDIAPSALAAAREKGSIIPDDHFILGDFFEHEGQYDLILEQTFFCALHPSLRPAYAMKMHDLLKKGGRLVGLLFEDKLFEDHPPFGGNREEYKGYFEGLFQFERFDRAHNSIPPRAGRELFISLVKG